MQSSVSISVITATYNSAKYLRHTMDSIKSQNCESLQYVVVDGGSSDGTLDILRDRGREISELLVEPDDGIYDALNKGLRLANGEIVGILHSDDFYADSNVLSDVASAFSDRSVNVVYGNLEYVNASNPEVVARFWRAGAFSKRSLVRGWMPPHPTVFFRRSFLTQIGPFDTGLKIAADYDHMIRTFKSDLVCPIYLPRVLVRMRVGGISNRNLSTIGRKMREDYFVIKRSGIGGVTTLLLKNFRKVGQLLVRDN